MRILSQRDQRLQDSYLKDKYTSSINYDDYFLIKSDSHQVAISVLPGTTDLDIKRDISSHDRIFVEKKILLVEVLLKNLDSDSISYIPGSVDFDDNFFPHPLNLDGILLISLKEQKIRSDTAIEITVLAYTSNKPVIYSFTIPNYKGILYAETFINRLLIAKRIGISFERLKRNHLIVTEYKNNISRIFTFVSHLKIKEWSETLNNVGKDNAMNSGLIIFDIPDDFYLKHLMNSLTKYRISKDGVSYIYDEIERGYFPSKKYEEKEIEGSYIKHEILIGLIRGYDQEQDFIYSMVAF